MWRRVFIGIQTPCFFLTFSGGFSLLKFLRSSGLFLIMGKRELASDKFDDSCYKEVRY